MTASTRRADDGRAAAESDAAARTAGAAQQAERLAAEIRRLTSEQATFEASHQQRRQALEADTAKAQALRDRLAQELSLLEENLEDISFGIYKPHFHFDTPEQYKRQLERVCEQQKAMVRSGEAARFAA